MEYVLFYKSTLCLACGVFLRFTSVIALIITDWLVFIIEIHCVFVRLEQFLEEQNGNNCTCSGPPFFLFSVHILINALSLVYSTDSMLVMLNT